MKTPTHVDQESKSMPRFLTLFAVQTLSLLGSELVQFALIWWLTQTSGSARVLALASLVGILPRIFISPFAGALVDRWNRRIVMIVADAAIALATLVLVVIFALDIAQVWHVYVLMFIRALGGAFHWPAMQASTPLLVPDKQLSRVAGMNQTVQGLSVIVIPPLSALLLSWVSIQGILAIDVATAILAITPLFFIVIPQPHRQATPEAVPGKAKKPSSKPSVLSDVAHGLRFIWGWPAFTIMITFGAIANLMANPAFSLVPLLVSGHFGGGALELGWLQSAFGIGVIAGGLTLSIWGGFKRRTITMYLAQALGGLGFVIIGLLPSTALPLAVGAAFLMGFTNPILNGAMMALFQATVPAEMQGRIFTVMLSITGITTPLGLLIAGPVGDTFGVQPWFLVSGIVTSAMGIVAFFIPSLMQIEARADTAKMNQESLPVNP